MNERSITGSSDENYPRQKSFTTFVEQISDLTGQKTLIEKRKPVEDSAWAAVISLNRTTYLLGIFQFIILILFAFCTNSEVLNANDEPGSGTEGYNMFIGVEIMM
jgi:hypothetical protein